MMDSSVDSVDCGNDGTSLFRNFEDRLATYANWLGKVNPEDLAYTGFYYTQKKDIVRCAFCFCEFHNWSEGDDPLEDHYKAVKYCELARVLWKCRKFKQNKPRKEKRKTKTKTLSCNLNQFFVLIIFVIFLSALFQNYEALKTSQQM